jgi:mRNA interferase RelE/StbE
MKKFVVIERSPEAGEPLGGVLSGFRKLTIGDRDWRVAWRVTSDNSGTTVVDIGEIWAVGARKDSEVYAGMRVRLAALPSNHQTKTIQQVLDLLESKTKRKKPAARITEDPESVAAPSWLVDDLVNFAGYREDVAQHLTEAQALKAWASFRSNEY